MKIDSNPVMKKHDTQPHLLFDIIPVGPIGFSSAKVSEEYQYHTNFIASIALSGGTSIFMTVLSEFRLG